MAFDVAKNIDIRTKDIQGWETMKKENKALPYPENQFKVKKGESVDFYREVAMAEDGFDFKKATEKWDPKQRQEYIMRIASRVKEDDGKADTPVGNALADPNNIKTGQWVDISGLRNVNWQKDMEAYQKNPKAAIVEDNGTPQTPGNTPQTTGGGAPQAPGNTPQTTGGGTPQPPGGQPPAQRSGNFSDYLKQVNSKPAGDDNTWSKDEVQAFYNIKTIDNAGALVPTTEGSTGINAATNLAMYNQLKAQADKANTDGKFGLTVPTDLPEINYVPTGNTNAARRLKEQRAFSHQAFSVFNSDQSTTNLDQTELEAQGFKFEALNYDTAVANTQNMIDKQELETTYAYMDYDENGIITSEERKKYNEEVLGLYDNTTINAERLKAFQAKLKQKAEKIKQDLGTWQPPPTTP